MSKPLTPREHVRRECKRRKRTWGSENEARLKAMRLEIALLKEKPSRWIKCMTDYYRGKRSLGSGGYMHGRHSKLSDTLI